MCYVSLSVIIRNSVYACMLSSSVPCKTRCVSGEKGARIRLAQNARSVIHVQSNGYWRGRAMGEGGGMEWCEIRDCKDRFVESE